MTNITTQVLLDAGYKPFFDRTETQVLGDWYRVSYQKRVRDDVGTRYFITIVHGVMPPHGDNPEAPFYTPKDQFTRNGQTFNVEILHPKTLGDIESFYADLWTTMRLDYYEGPDEASRWPQPPVDPLARLQELLTHSNST